MMQKVVPNFEMWFVRTEEFFTTENASDMEERSFCHIHNRIEWNYHSVFSLRTEKQQTNCRLFYFMHFVIDCFFFAAC